MKNIINLLFGEFAQREVMVFSLSEYNILGIYVSLFSLCYFHACTCIYLFIVW